MMIAGEMGGVGRVESVERYNTISKKTTIVWDFLIAVIGGISRSALQKILCYLLQTIKKMV
jgi:hypothetical protein